MNLRTCLAVVLGIGIGALLFRTSNPPAPALVSPDEASAPVAHERPLRALAAIPPPHLVERAVFSLTAPLSRAAEAPAPMPSKDELKLSLSRDDLAELEARGDLASKVRVWQTAEGWRIELLSPDSLLERVGLRSGDVITFASLRRQLDDPDRRNLAGRMTALLDHLAQ